LPVHVCQAAKEGRKALIPYVTAGFPFADITPELMHGMVTAGADVIELGVPFSDPSADGPVIQKAGDRRWPLASAWCRCWTWCASFRQKDHHARGADGLRQPGGALQPTPWRWLRTADGGYQPLCATLRPPGVDGVLIVDYPPEECAVSPPQLKAHGMDLIFSAGPHQHRRAHGAGRPRSPAATCTTCRSRA
jgi:tryptophan synthase alpha chain